MLEDQSLWSFPADLDQPIIIEIMSFLQRDALPFTNDQTSLMIYIYMLHYCTQLFIT